MHRNLPLKLLLWIFVRRLTVAQLSSRKYRWTIKRLSLCQEDFLCSMASVPLQEKAPFLQDLSGGTEVFFSSLGLWIVHLAGVSETSFLCPQIFFRRAGSLASRGMIITGYNRLWYWLVKLRKFKGVKKGLGAVFLNPEHSHIPFLMQAAWWALADLDEGRKKPHKAQVYHFPLGSTQVGAIWKKWVWFHLTLVSILGRPDAEEDGLTWGVQKSGVLSWF